MSAGWVLLAVGLIVLAVLATWWNALEAGFVFDDIPRIVESETRIDALWPPAELLRRTQRPVVQCSLALNHAFGGLEPRGYHAFNIAVHSMAAVVLLLLVFHAGRRLVDRGVLRCDDRSLLGVATASTLLWALHPLQTAAVTYVIQRAESLAGLFLLAAALALLRVARGSAAWGLACVAAMLLALGSKPTAVCGPAVLLAVDWFVVTGSLRESLRRRWPLHIALWASLALLCATGAVQGVATDPGRMTGAGRGVAGVGPLDYAVSQVRAIGLYLTLIVRPAGMSIDHGADALIPFNLAVIGWCAILGSLSGIVAGVARRAWWAVLPAWFVLTLAPTSSIVPLADPAADQRMYLPLAALAVLAIALLGAGVGRLLRNEASSRRWPLVAAGALIAALAGLEAWATITRNEDYREPAALWSEVISRRPDHARGLVNRGALQLEAGRFEEAERDLLAAFALQPGNPRVLLNLAILDVRFGRPDEAIARLAIVGKSLPNDPTRNATLGDAYRAAGRPADAVEAYAAAIARRPGEPWLPFLMGNALSDLERHDEAADAFARAAELAADPSLRASALFNLGNTRFRQERYGAAAVAYRAALRTAPDHAGAKEWLEEAERLAGE